MGCRAGAMGVARALPWASRIGMIQMIPFTKRLVEPFPSNRTHGATLICKPGGDLVQNSSLHTSGRIRGGDEIAKFPLGVVPSHW